MATKKVLRRDVPRDFNELSFHSSVEADGDRESASMVVKGVVARMKAGPIRERVGKSFSFALDSSRLVLLLISSGPFYLCLCPPPPSEAPALSAISKTRGERVRAESSGVEQSVALINLTSAARDRLCRFSN